MAPLTYSWRYKVITKGFRSSLVIICGPRVYWDSTRIHGLAWHLYYEAVPSDQYPSMDRWSVDCLPPNIGKSGWMASVNGYVHRMIAVATSEYWSSRLQRTELRSLFLQSVANTLKPGEQAWVPAVGWKASARHFKAILACKPNFEAVKQEGPAISQVPEAPWRIFLGSLRLRYHRRTHRARNKRSGAKARIPCSNSNVKSNSRRHGSTRGPKWLSVEIPHYIFSFLVVSKVFRWNIEDQNKERRLHR